MLYVGKADRLRERVRSYFVAEAGALPQGAAGRAPVGNGATGRRPGSPLEAVVREQELILEHRPPCNVQGRKPENYVYLKAAGKDRGLRALRQRHAGSPTAGIVLGPFRGRSRILQAARLAPPLLPHPPVRRSARRGPVCLYGTDAAAACRPARATGAARSSTTACWSEIVGWVRAERLPKIGDPSERATPGHRGAVAQRRFEEAQRARDAHGAPGSRAPLVPGAGRGAVAARRRRSGRSRATAPRGAAQPGLGGQCGRPPPTLTPGNASLEIGRSGRRGRLPGGRGTATACGAQREGHALTSSPCPGGTGRAAGGPALVPGESRHETPRPARRWCPTPKPARGVAENACRAELRLTTPAMKPAAPGPPTSSMPGLLDGHLGRSATTQPLALITTVRRLRSIFPL